MRFSLFQIIVGLTTCGWDDVDTAAVVRRINRRHQRASAYNKPLGNRAITVQAVTEYNLKLSLIEEGVENRREQATLIDWIGRVKTERGQ